MRTLIAFVLATAAAAAPALAGPFEGTYYPGIALPGAWDCKSIGMDGGALAVQGDELIGVENRCTLTAPVEVRDMDAVLYDAQCAGEGETTSERVMLMRSTEGLYVIRDGFVADWLRCP